jgi:hypothetical protein
MGFGEGASLRIRSERFLNGHIKYYLGLLLNDVDLA